jgi:hypothetical protein
VGEILLGGRRPYGGRARRWVRSLLVAVPLVLVAVLVGWLSFLRATRYPVPGGSGTGGELVAEGARLRLGASSLERAGGVWLLRVEGTPWEMGVARGRLLGAVSGGGVALEAAIEGERAPSGWLASARHRAGVRWRLRLLADGIPRERREELAGLAAGLAASGGPGAPSYQKLVRRTAALDVGARPGLGLPVGGVASSLAVAGASDDGMRVWLAHVFALPLAPAAPETVVTLARPAGKLAWAGVGWAHHVGVVTGVNVEGVAVALSPSLAEDVRVTAARLPLPLLARQILEECKTLDEAVALVKAAQPLGAGSFTIVDGKTRAWVVIERTPERVAVRRGGGEPPRPLVAGDFLQSPELGKDAENARGRRVYGRPTRDARLAALAARGFADGLALLAILRERGTDGGRTLPLGHPAAVDDLGAQHVAVIDASGLLLWVGEGPGAAGAFRAIDLRADLAGEPPRALAPEQALWPAALMPAGELERAVRARVLTVEAARLLRAGAARRALETATRAMALAPDLPDALLVAARAATRLGDGARARELYRQYLERAPADGAGAEEARGVLGVL